MVENNNGANGRSKSVSLFSSFTKGAIYGILFSQGTQTVLPIQMDYWDIFSVPPKSVQMIIDGACYAV